MVVEIYLYRGNISFHNPHSPLQRISSQRVPDAPMLLEQNPILNEHHLLQTQDRPIFPAIDAKNIYMSNTLKQNSEPKEQSSRKHKSSKIPNAYTDIGRLGIRTEDLDSWLTTFQQEDKGMFLLLGQNFDRLDN